MDSQTLQKRIAERLMMRLPSGLTEYSMIWKPQVTPARRLIYRLAASARRTSGKDFGGWPTPTRDQAGGTAEQFLERKRRAIAKGSKMGVSLTDLGMVAQMAGWPTPMAGTPKQKGYNEAGNTDSSRKTVALAGWATPNAPRKHDSDLSAFRWNPNKKQDDPVMQLIGRDQYLSDVPTEKRGALNPEFSLWLMGFPTAWASFGARVTPSSRKSPQSS